MRARRLWIAAAGAHALLLVALLGATLAWAPAAGLLAWDPATGTLRALAPGWHLLPRWRWERLPAAALRGEARLPTADGHPVVAALTWHPAAGTYPLAPAPSPAAGLVAAVEAGAEASGDRLLDVPLACVLAGPAAEGGKTGAAACPPGWESRVRERLAAHLQTAPGRLGVRLSPTADARRAGRLGELAARLPKPERRVLLLGLDGFDWDLVLPWVEAGRLPHLARLMAAGTWGELDTLVPTLSPLVWTTIATGVSPEVHGILDFVERDPESGRMIPVTGRGRQAPAIWNIASALGRSASVVGWWATWPAEEIAGVMVSDRLYYTLVKTGPEPELAEDAPGVVSPAERTPEFARLRSDAVRETGWEEVRAFMDVRREEFGHAVREARGMDDPIDGFRRILAATHTYLAAGLELAASRPDLLMVYLEGTDTIGHLLAPYMPPPVAADTPAGRAAVYAAAVPRYFARVDEWIGRYLESCPLDECSWVLVSDHGFKWREGRPTGIAEHSGLTAPLWHEEDAIFVIADPGIPARGRLAASPGRLAAPDGGPPASVYDVAPTILALLGLPPGAGWRGSPLPGVEASGLPPVDYGELLPPSAVARPATPATAADDEFLAQLQALGYLDPTAAEPAAGPGGAGSAAGAGSRTLGELNNLGILLLDEGRLAEAEAVLRRAVARHPEHPYAPHNLYLVLAAQGRDAEAEAEMWAAIEKRWRDPAALVASAATRYLERQEPGRAAALLREGTRRLPREPRIWLELLTLRTRLEQCAPGLEEARRAAAYFPDAPRVHGFRGLLAMCLGKGEEARAAMRRSLELDPDQPALREALAAMSSPS